ncbi:hypothetical protein BGZ65_012604, partial [Modicella reniformis]
CEGGLVNGNTQDRLYEEIEEGKRPGELLVVPEWFKSQHTTMVNGGLVENAI